MDENDMAITTKPRKKKKKWKRRFIKFSIFLLFVLFITFIIGCYTILPLPFLHSSHPENVAEDYAVACLNEDMDALYKCYEFDNSPLLSEKAFKKAFIGDISRLSTYSITKNPGASSGSNKVFRVAFHRAHQSEVVSSQAIIVTRTKKRTLYIFDHWVLNSDNLISKNITLILPSCGTAYIDDVPLKDGKSTDVMGQKKYTVSSLFTGRHTLRFVAPGHKDYERSFTTTSGDLQNRIVATLDTATLSLSEQGKKACSTLAENLFTSIYTNGLKHKSFEQVFADVEVEKDFLKALKSSYQTLLINNMTKGANFCIAKLKLKSFKTKVTKNTFSPDGHPSAIVRLKAKYKATSKVKRIVGKKTIVKKKTKKVRVKVYKKDKKGKKTKKYKWVMKKKIFKEKKKKPIIKSFTKSMKGTADCHFTLHLKKDKWVLYDTNSLGTYVIYFKKY